MKVIMVIWTVVGGAGTNAIEHKYEDWRPIGVFETKAYCMSAAKRMEVEKRFLCLESGETK